MHLGKRIALGLLLLPAVEVAAFLLLAWLIGLVPTLALMVLTSLTGVLLLRRAGSRPIGQAQAALRTAGSGAGVLALAGILLVLPGFVTDLIGAGMLVGPVRRWLVRRIIEGNRAAPRGPDTVIDLDPQEWRRLAERKPRQRKPR